jgi:two-component system, chemotaxis family, CheB/CheR fusion protein
MDNTEHENISVTNINKSPIEEKKFHIIGIGASAGGLEAIHELFDSIPDNTGYAFIVVQHLSQDYKSLMPTLISKHTKMTIVDAVENLQILPNHVYFIPNDKLMTIKSGKLKLTQKTHTKEPNRAIDIFLNSLAEDQGEFAIGIILSGTGTDGTEGIDSIKKAGGFTLVQEPFSAKFDGMPNSAILSGNVDFISTPELMLEEINIFVNEPRVVKGFLDSFTSEDEIFLQEIFILLRNQISIDFSLYKRPTIIRRIIRRMLFNKIEKLKGYINFLKKTPEEIVALGKEFLIGVTKFFRDSEAFDILENNIIPAIVDNKLNSSEPIKMWVAGCSTGEEAYSIAILLKEYFRKIEKRFEVRIFATDIDKAAIEFASKGFYPLAIAKDVTSDQLDRYFILENGKYHIIPEIRKMVIFAAHDLPKDAPFSKMDLVTCRNLLIYFTPALQKRALNSIHFSLNPNGYLFLGTSENLGDLSTSFSEIDKKYKFYQNRNIAKVSFQNSFISPDLRQHSTVQDKYVFPFKTKPSKDSYTETLFETAFEEFVYAGVYVTEDFQILEARGEINNFIQLPQKRFDLNILKMVDENMSLALATGLRKSIKTGNKVQLNGLKINKGDKSRMVDIIIRPFLTESSLDKKCLLILFSEQHINVSEQKAPLHSYNLSEMEGIREIEKELKETRENLQAASEVIETSNEELQSSNEELISSNEELQSTNEELQSLNEELHTVNTEHQLKLKELFELNDDLSNYFKATDIGQIFLDGDLKIRKFTPAARNQINLIDGDVGRPISHLSNNIKYNGLLKDIQHVINTSKPIEKNVEIANGKFYQMRVIPYEKVDKTKDGVVITFVDVSLLKIVNSDLEKRVNDRTEELTKAVKSLEGSREQFSLMNLELIDKNEKLVITNNDLDNFIYTASHDLRAPVSNIEGLINSLEEGAYSKDEDANLIIGLIKESIQRFKHTIKDLTEITKIQRLAEEDIDEINVSEIVNDVKLTIREMIEESKAEISCEFDESVVIRFSRKNFRSIIYNLLSNSIKYKSLDKLPVIKIKTENIDGNVILSIKDNGLGINEYDQTKMFTMFKRFHDHVEGTGVGLYLVKRIVDNAGGTIDIKSKVGEGTLFSIYFKK